MVQVDLAGRHVEQRGELPLEADRDVAQPDGLVPGLEQRPGDDADRVGEVDDPGVWGGPAYPFGDVEHHRHGPQRLGETAGPGGLLADAAALQRPCLVLVAGRLAADPELEQHGVRAGHSRLQVGGGDDPAGMPLLGEDPPRQAPDQFQAVGGRIDQHQLLDRQGVAQPRESVDEFRCVGGPAAHDCQFHPLTPVRVTPSMKAFCAKKKTTITGAITRTVAAMVRFQLVWWAPLKDSNP